MKKTISTLLLFMLLFIPVLVFQRTEASQSGQLLKYEKKLKVQVSEFANSRYVEDIIVVPTEKYQKEEVLKMIERISRIHPTILEKVVENNIRLKLFTGSLTDQPGFTHLKGLKPRGYVRYTWDDVPGAGGTKLAHAKVGHSAKGKGHGSVNLELHELAHSIDKHVFRSLRSDPLFIEIWAEEAEFLFAGQPYFIDHPEEYFAEAFAMYYLGFFTRSELEVHAPRTFQYINDLHMIEKDRLKLALSFG
ncbi:anthrax toxin lethal factor-related metalloendopeptidase [Bacillus sp. DJP31]|uniref:anthrax toxin lethal factor-related metalloendopeptidase n=1 Tax=Bacillus sp. DJP31 TaxID=3409789 RepID=UPI003BB4B70E